MDQSNILIQSITSLEGHWALDNYLINKDSTNDVLILDAIKCAVEERTSRIDSEATKEEVEVNINSNFRLPNFSPKYSIQKYRKNYSSQTQRWMGYILDIKENIIYCRVEDLINRGTYEEVEFDIDDISKEDKELVSIGAIFYWSVSKNNKNGQLVKESIIRFQRVADWNESDYDSASDRAERWNNNINWD